MAVFKLLTCDCGKVRQVQTEKIKGERCPHCGGAATKYSKWKLSVYIGGEKYSETMGDSKADALAREAELIRRASSGEITTKPSSYTLKEAAAIFDKWCTEQVENGSLDSKTAKRYMSAINTNVLPILGNTNITRLDHITIDDYIRVRKTQPIKDTDKFPKPATINRELTAISRLLTICVRKRMLSRNPMEDYPKLGEPKTRDRALTKEEIAKLLEACGDRVAPKHLKTMVTVALHTGLRKEGILGLRWEHIDWKGNKITRTVKQGKEVRIPLTAQLKKALLEWKLANETNIGGWVFPSPKKSGVAMLVSSNIGFDAAVKRAGLGDFIFHQLRHCFITHLIMQTKDIQLAADIAGHSTLWITQRYTHLLEDHKQDAMKGFGL